MRWPHKYRNAPPAGATRERHAFLWLPRLDTDNYWRWLETATVEDIWDQGVECFDMGYFVDGNFKWRLNKILPRKETK